MNLKQLAFSLMAIACGLTATAAPVKVTMNSVSPTMTITAKGSDTKVETGEPENNIYTFDTPAGEYVLTAYATDGTTVNGTIVLNVADAADEQAFAVLTNTAYVKNTNEDESPWTVENGDYIIDFSVMTKEGDTQTVTIGNSETAGRKTILALNGNTLNIQYIPGEARQTEGYITAYLSGTLTYNRDVSGTIVRGNEKTITVPADAELSIGMKFAHFIDFTIVEPKSVKTEGDTKTYNYLLSPSQTYNYRTWREGGITQAGTGVPTEFTDESYKTYDPKQINHAPQSNQGYETGDIFVNINPQGHLKLNVGDSFYAHAMRTWQLTNTQIDNYFMEPDFHYTVIGIDGKPSTGVIEIDNADTHESPWSEIKAVGNGTAIVLVTYDAILLPSNWMGGGFWGAIWPENTAAYVVTVGEDATGINPNMVINEEYNLDTKKLAGKYVDAEHDVFYYLDTEEGARYTFKPEGVDNVTIAYPTIGEQMATYSGFSGEGVTKNEDGSYTLLLKHGRNIVRLSDASGKSVYQILTAKPCHREITNVTRPDANDFQPGDEIKIQFSGLFHPANKLAGIYNMSAYVTYNGTPNGTSLILGAGQYTFGSAPAAQAVQLTIPKNYDTETNPEFVLDEGVIQVNGYGDPIGNHRNINRLTGRQANFTATAHKTYFGAIPEVRIPLTPIKTYKIKINCNVSDAEISLVYTTDNIVLTQGENSEYTGYAGDYYVSARKAGYRMYRNKFSIAEDAEGIQTFTIEMIEAPDAWDGVTLTEPALNDGFYQISDGAELAWFANHVNTAGENQNAVLADDIDLADYDWTPIGQSSAAYKGKFDGNFHSVKGLYIDVETSYVGLFGYSKEGSIDKLAVYGYVNGSGMCGGIIGSMYSTVKVDRCVNYATVCCSGNPAGGIAGVVARGSSITNSYNVGQVSGSSQIGGILGRFTGKQNTIANVFSIGAISGESVGACFGATSSNATITNAFAISEYQITDSQTLVTDEQMRSGEVAYKLGEAFGQEIGVDEHPVLGGMKVLYDEVNDRYYNENGGSSGIGIITAEEAEGAVYYNLQGVASESPFKGLNIVRLRDGSTRKIFVR